MEVLNKN